MAFTRIRGAGIHTTSNINTKSINATGIITASSFVGDGSALTGIANTDFVVGTAITMTTANFTGSVTIGGTLTYEDVTNIDSVGIITARDSVVLKHQASGKFAQLNSNAAGAAVIKADPNNNAANSSIIFQVDGTEAGRFETDRDLTVGNPSAAIGYGATISSIGNITAGIITGTTINATLFNGPSQIGIQSAGTQIGAGITQLNFVGTGNTFAVNGTTVDISIAGGGGGTGAGGTWSTYTAGIATSKSVGVNTTNLDDTDLTGIGNSFKGLYISNGMIIHDNVLNGNHYIGTSMSGLMAGPVTIDGNLEIDGNYVVV